MRGPRSAATNPQAGRLWDSIRDKGISGRESDVIWWLAKGKTNKEIGQELYVCEKTVKFHLTNIFKKLNLRSRAQVIVWVAPKLTWVDEPPTSTNT